MAEIKYTNDGKKVVVIGNLNNQEKIVQEIFIVNNVEVPSGENFVVKTLHDAPAVSWQEKRTKEIEVQYNNAQKEYDELHRQLRQKQTDIRNKLSYAGAVLKNVSPESFDTLVMFLTGNVKYIVCDRYKPEIFLWDEYKQNYEDRLRLISFFGKDDGTLTYGIGTYYDSSGSNTYFKPFSNYEDAFDYFKKSILSKPIDGDIIKLAEQHKIELPVEPVKEYYKKRIEALDQNIKNYQTQLSGWESERDNFKKIILP